ncbi:MAG TPA: hypothetical protein EYO84_10900, partial [Planctomycetes bacterium]|nr:hypothetical protein [Planctomycetota bacterium]
MIDRIEEEGETVFQHNYEEYYGGSQIARSRVVASLDGEFWAYDSGERQPSGPFPDLRSALTENSVVEGSPDIFLAVGSNTDRIWSALSTEELLDLLDVSGLEPGARLEVDGTIFNLLDVSWLDSWVTPLEDRFGPMPPTVTVTRTEQRRTSTVSRSGPSMVLVREEPLVFSGSLMNGPDIDLLRFAGIRFWLFSDEQHDALWSDTSELGLLEECWSVDRDSLGTNEIPLYSDEYFEFTVSSPIRFQAELRNIISERLNLSDEDWEEILGDGAPEQESDLNLSHLTSPEGLELPEHVGGCLDLSGLTSAEGLKLPEHVGENLGLSGLTSAEGVKLPEDVGWSLDLSGLTSAEG